MKRLLLFLTIILTACYSQAQQDPQFSHNMFAHLATNPGSAGMGKGICATVIQRNQWFGFTGAPVTSYLGLGAGIKPFGVKSGVGLTINGDNLGFYKNLDLKGIYAYHAEMFGGELSFGLGLGFISNGLDATWVFPESSEQGIPTKVDDLQFDMDFGMFFKRNRLYLGLSAKHLLEPTIKLSNQETTTVNRHYYLTGGYTVATPIPQLEVEPSVFVKSDGSSYQFSVNTNVIYNKKIWGGVSYRAGDAVIAMLGLELINNLKLGFAYDITTSKVQTVSDGTTEVFLKYCFEIAVPQYTQKYKSARFL